jgi:hypothetical protein
MQNKLRYVILKMDFPACMRPETEMDFTELTTLQLELVEMAFTMAVARISVGRMKDPEVITATLMMALMWIVICPTTKHSGEDSLHALVRHHIFVTNELQLFLQSVMIVACASHRHWDNTLNTANVSRVRIRMHTDILQP